MALGGRHSQNVFCERQHKKPVLLACYESTLELASWVMGAGDGTRTRDSLLGRQAVAISPLVCYELALLACVDDTFHM